ncbi:MAG TPA: hypothetical protein VEF05_02595 [Terriglobales bacterium]|nr:hypothetical protein [Terriglobales bacterium]
MDFRRLSVMIKVMVRKKHRAWIPGVVFWVLFLVCIGLYPRHRWLDFAWNAAWMLLLIVIASWAVVEMFRHRHEGAGYLGYRGVPRWVVRLFGGDCD